MSPNRSIRSTPAPPRPDAGFSVVLVTATILVLLILGLALVSIVSENSGLSVHHVQSSQAFYVAQAGLEYAIKKLSANPAWGGLASPGKTVGPGSFTIAAPDTVDENGAPLAAGRKRVVSTGVVGEATRVLQIQVTTGGISTYAGTGSAGYTGDGGAATSATFKNPEGVAVGPDGSIYVVDSDNHVVRKINPATGVVTTVAGSGSPGWSGDGLLATAARLQQPQDVAVASNGDLYIADTGNHSIRKVTAATGLITTVAGSGSPGSTGDAGPATLAKLSSPRGIVLASNGDLYIADRSNNKIRKVSALTGIITTFAGTGTAGYTGDGGLALAARLQSPEGVELASNGDLYIADTSNNAIRRVSSLTGFITTIAGTGTAGYTGDGGAATAARLNGPESVTVSASGDLYVADRANNVIRRFTIGGTIATFAGTGTAGYSGDGGSATAAKLNGPAGIAIDASGVVYVADTSNQRVRKISGSLSIVGWVETRV
jgi:streptogramin lyase